MAYNLKNEEEVNEYLKNLHIEYQFGCYSEKNPEVCHLLGNFYEAIKLDTDKAASLYKTTCDQYNYARSCAKFGDFKVIGKGCEKDIPTAYKYLSKSCELNDEYGCLHAGVLGTSKSDIGEKDRATQIHTGVKYLKKACDVYNLDKACFYLSAGLKRLPCDSLINDTTDITMRFYFFLISRTWLAAAVFVTLVSHGILSNAQSTDSEPNKNIINVDVYYESLCSDSMRWIVNQLVPSYPELKRHIHVTLVPFGKATHHRESETGPWQFLCQHGPSECRGNKAQACAIHAIRSSEATENHQPLMVNLVGCAMLAGTPGTAVPQCAQAVGLSTETRKLIDDCIASPLADNLLAANGDKTEALQSPLRFVPTIVINGVYSKENQDEAIRNFPKLICRHLTAEKPSICSSESAEN
ncbi:COA7 factor, partial [Acromyrmex charruanus]